MARYIDADALMEKIRRCEFDITGRGIVYDAGEVQSIINFMPATDVAPKSDVERLESICHSYALQYGTVTDQQKVIDKAKAEVAREIFEELDEFIVTRVCYVYGQAYDISDKYVELKKKYTEEKL